MNRRLVLWLVTLLFAAESMLAVSADDLCPICSKRYGQKIYALTKRGREEKVLVCADCVKLETRCYICGVPAKDKFTKLADGNLDREQVQSADAYIVDAGAEVFVWLGAKGEKKRRCGVVCFC